MYMVIKFFHMVRPDSSIKNKSKKVKWKSQSKNYPGKRPQTVCARSVNIGRKCRDLDALRPREVMVVMKVGIVVTVAVVVSECECE